MTNPNRPRGVLFDPSVPHGSPLDPTRDPAMPQGILSLQSPAPQGILTAPSAPMAPSASTAPPQVQGALSPAPTGTIDRKSYKPFSKENRSDTLLAIGTGLLSHPESFAAGIGAAGEKAGALRKDYLTPTTSKLGGPDDAFQVITDKRTGEQTFKPVEPFVSYLDRKAAATRAPKPNDNVDMRSSTANAILNLPPEQQEAAYHALRADADRLGYDLGMPEQYTPVALEAWRDQGITASAAASGARAAENAAQLQAERDRNYGLRAQAGNLARDKFKRGPPPKASPAAKLSTGFILDN